MNWIYDPAPPTPRRATTGYSDTPVQSSDTPVQSSDTPVQSRNTHVNFYFFFYEWEHRTGTMCPFSSLHPSRNGKERR